MLNFKFPCPHCGAYLSVNTSLIGRKGRCKKCAGVIFVPILANSIYESNTTIIKKLEWQNLCPMCKNFELQNQVCAKLHLNVQSNPGLFKTKCSGDSFELSANKVQKFRENEGEETKQPTPPLPVEKVKKNKTGICPYCRTKIEPSDNVFICSNCKTPHHLDCWQENNGCTVYGCENAPPDEEKITVQNDAELPDDNSPIFFYIPISRLILMSILSFGLYEAYWIYKNWRYLNDRDNLNIQPFWRGVFGIFYCHGILKSIRNDSSTNKYEKGKFSAGGLTTGWIILRYLGYAFGKVSIIAGAIGLFIFPSYLFFIPAQNFINRINSSRQPKPSYNSWSAGHILCIVIGIIYWLLVLVSFSELS
jgi:hypothetical protein